MKTKFYALLLVLCGAGPLLANRAAAQAATVTGFVLVNADTDLDLITLTPGMVLDLNGLPTQNLNIRAEVDSPVGSVTFALSGAQAQAATENLAPYALFSDFGGDYFAWTPPLGSYVLTATPFAAGGGTGPAGTPLTLSFSVVNSALAVTGFTLVNADTDLDLEALTAGMVLNTNTLPTQQLNIRANANPAVTGSVVFSLSGPVVWTATENVAPYALFSDLLGDYFGQPLLPGTYSLTATPFSAPAGAGVAGAGLTLNFSVVAAPLPVELAAFSAKALADGRVLLRWQTASETNNREFEIQRSLDGQQFSLMGRVPGQGNSTTPHDYAFTDPDPAADAPTRYYRLRQLDFNGTAHYSPVRAVAGSPAPAALRLHPAGAGEVQYTFSGLLTGTESVLLYNLLGQCLGRYPVGATGTGTVPVAGLQAGVYVLHLPTREGRFTCRFVLP
ncbi:T9SS type A sorting domain-containing protein [Hymenobacter convexus]|uniref:T9SS type A sorting domain-containing protein n=1 Tax=Hymenobacter sp. CA1UV-4 TaxID=3063782 RepID=UPI0027135D80|nr:T9SS type A sorting domain-containing protein [Hymenobacter sp. CA1UV-4]MDO7852481.1 T9SS type A sorting domain-containing protein [Hymenobacter sp. CA1UV-4]